MKQFSADFIYTMNTTPIKNGVVEVNNRGEIIAVLDPIQNCINWDKVKKLNGIICPGFVNTHCHLELSYLKGEITEKTKLTGFVRELMNKRNNFSEQERLLTIKEAEQEMINNGIVAVGDISNGDSTFLTKQNSQLRYHTFIEVFGSDPKIAQEAFSNAKRLFNSYFNKQHASITPHATYSVSDQLTTLVNNHCTKHNSIVSIHNQETLSENEFFKHAKGELYEFLEIDKKLNFIASGENALPSFLAKYKNLNKILLVHNTYTKKEDIEWANNYNNEVYFAFCPNANLYIENTLPNFNLFTNQKCTIGTDSYASNWGLSILDELKTIAASGANIPLQKLLEWATINGAQFLGFDNELGSIEVGKTPGLNLISGLNEDKFELTSETVVEKLI